MRSWRGALADYSMASASSGGTLTVHGLVQAVERAQLQGAERERWIKAAIDMFVSHAPPHADQVEH